MFIALVPPDDVVTDLERFLAGRTEADPSLQWSDADHWHLTLAFLPDVTDGQSDELSSRLSSVASRHQPPALQLAGAGTFPNPVQAKVLYAAAAGDLTRLGALAAGTRTAASTSGIAVDGAAFRGHLTLARSSRPQNLTRWLTVFSAYSGPTWTATELSLIESHLDPGSRSSRRPGGRGSGGRRGRPRYEVHDTFALDGS